MRIQDESQRREKPTLVIWMIQGNEQLQFEAIVLVVHSELTGIVIMLFEVYGEDINLESCMKRAELCGSIVPFQVRDEAQFLWFSLRTEENNCMW